MRAALAVAVLALWLLAPPGHAWADFAAGQAAYERQDYALARKEWEPAAEHGDARALFGLGTLYHRGDGVRADPRMAARLFRVAADKGHAEAQFAYGMALREADGLPRDRLAAGTWFLRAARQGHAAARYALGGMYEQGLGVDHDDAKALAWYRLAAEVGHYYATERANRLTLNSSYEKIKEAEGLTLDLLVKGGL